DQEIVRIYTQLVSCKNANSVSYVTFKLDSRTTCRQVKEWALKKLRPNRSVAGPDDVRFYDIVMVVESDVF
uniref:Ras-associating domain-containing protein n=1 Tax=Romanomermis culicivorax TaxID=13658 RepID=A0A915JVY0_ROMCU